MPGETLQDRVHAACAELRFAEGLRRRSEEARAEATVREAAGLALLEGARVDPEVLRDTVRDLRAPEVLDPDLAVAVGAWKAAWSVTRRLPRLNPGPGGASGVGIAPLRQVIAQVQRQYGSGLVHSRIAGVEQVAIPEEPVRWADVLRAIEAPRLSALESAGRAWALLTLESPFPHGNQLTGILVAKWILSSRGVEPTGASVLSAHPLGQRAGYEASLSAIERGDWRPWKEFFAETLVRGAEVGQQVARHVQAGRPV